MKLGKTEHKVKLEDKTFEVGVIVEDTQKSVVNGVMDFILVVSNSLCSIKFCFPQVFGYHFLK